MMKRDAIESEIDEFRLEIFDEIKNMSREEYLEYYRLHGERIANEFGFKIEKPLKSKKED